MTTLPTLRELLDAGVHFGHKTSRWNPKMKDYIFTSKSSVHVINLEKTQEFLKNATDFLVKEMTAGRVVLFVGTKKQAGDIVKKAAEDCKSPYIVERWLGGLLTNFSIVQKAVKKLERAKIKAESDAFDKMTKRDKVLLKKEIDKRTKLVGGLLGMNQKPDILILIGAHDEKNAILEAQKMNVTTIALVDTNSDPNQVNYPIPANDDATKSIKLFSRYFSKIIKQNRNIKLSASASPKRDGKTQNSKQ